MGSWNRSLLCALCCGFVLSFASSVVAQASQAAAPNLSQDNVQSTPAKAVPAQRLSDVTTASAELPDSPGAEWAKQSSSSQQQSSQQQSENDTGASQDLSSRQEQKPEHPVGTAAAEAPTVSGITAAEPAGVAIAPGKQHRARALVIKVGAIAGAGVALGTVVALGMATHSKPPGAH